MSPVRIRVAWLLALLVCAWFAIARTPISSELSDFMPAGDAADQALVDQLRKGAGARLLLIGIEGAAPERLAELSTGLAAALQPGGLFRRVVNGPLAVDEREQALLFEYRYLLAPTAADHFTTDALQNALRARFDDLSSPFTLDKADIPADPTAALRAVRGALQREGGPRLRFGVWFARHQDQALLLAETRAEGFDLDGQELAQGALREAFERLQPGEAHMVVTGAGVFAVASRDTIRRESQVASVLASSAMALLVFLAYRSARAVVLAALPLLFAMAVATVVTGALFGTVHGITLAFGITLIGVAGDYPLHLLSHLGPGIAPAQALLRIWPTMRLGVLTTCAGYLVMATTDFTGVAQLGTFAVAGLLAAAAFTRYALPSFVPAGVTPRLGPAHTLPRLPLAAALAFGVVVVVTLWWRPPAWEEDLAALSPLPADLREQDRALRQVIGAPEMGHVVLIRGPDAESVLQRCETLAADFAEPLGRGALTGWDAACRYLPSVQLQRERQATLPPPDVLRPRLVQASQGLPFRPGLFQPFVAGVDRSANLAPLTPADLAGTTRGAQVDTLLREHEGQWLGLVTLNGVSDSALLAQLTARHAGWATYLNTKARANEVLRQFRVEAMDRLLWGAALVLGLLALSLRSLPRALRALLPVALALGLDLLILTLLGQQLSLFHLVALLLVVGIAIDYSLFFDRRETQHHARRSTEHAVTLCAVSTVGAFGILAASTIPVLKAIGLTVAIGIVASYGFARLLAPAPDSQTKC
jgi:predicted exporter